MRLLHIYSCRGMGLKTIDKMFAHDPTFKEVYNMSKNDLKFYYQMNEKQADVFHQDLNKSIDELFRTEHGSFQFITRLDKEYPHQLRHIFDPPWILFYKGDLSLLHKEKSLAVVGTRYPTKQALPIMKQILYPLIRNDWCIVSGLAYGIDALSHQLALNENGSTIAVLGSGLQSIYPKEHKKLAETIANNGLLLSEFLPLQPPAKWQFPLRNRIISGLTRGTLVVEAKEKSGSLITADQALEQGREVFAIPGSVLNPNSKGTNNLIQQGAKMVLCSQDIENELFIEKN
ncbi:DNA-protecting protein DprA [Pueribacillus theae]|uniref:DNA-protecting protein DprA n=2 Tax=Pueribacillus theae TaxID=2171751 RepID=A0A2U1K8D4_9BACI|nr:DNA-protecting protein DprA [Pueribacillus theae]